MYTVQSSRQSQIWPKTMNNSHSCYQNVVESTQEERYVRSHELIGKLMGMHTSLAYNNSYLQHDLCIQHYYMCIQHTSSGNQPCELLNTALQLHCDYKLGLRKSSKIFSKELLLWIYRLSM